MWTTAAVARAQQGTVKTGSAIRNVLAHLPLAALKANIKEALVSLSANRQRTVLALVGLALGVASVTAMVSVGVTARAEAVKRFKDLGTETLLIRKSAGDPAVPRSHAVIRMEDVKALPTQASTIVAAAPASRAFGPVAYRGRTLGTKGIVGVTEAVADLNKLSLGAGRFISDLDADQRYCVVGLSVAQAMRDAGAKQVVGEFIALGGRLYTVVGELAHIPQSSLLPFSPDDSILLPITTARRLSGVEIQFVFARMADEVDHRAAAAEAQAHFQSRRQGLRVRAQTAEDIIAALRQQMRLFTLLLATVGGISLVVGGAGAMNVMLASVSERRREIGVRRALGACRHDIRNQFLIEAVTLSLAGGVLGIALGLIVPYAISIYAGWSFLVSPVAILAGFGVAAGVGVFFGAYPALRAAQLNPIIALRAQ